MLLVSALRARQTSTETLSTNCSHDDVGPNVCSHRAVVAHVSGISPTATILAVLAKFQMFRGRAVGHGLCDPQGVPQSSRTFVSVRLRTCFVVVMLNITLTDGIESPWNGIESPWICTVSAMKVNACVCALATDRDPDGVLSKSKSVRARKTVNYA